MGELRKDPILGRWVIIATERNKRPDSFASNRCDEDVAVDKCPFCEGKEAMTPPEISSVRNERTAPNTPGWQVRVVPNKYPACGIDDKLIKQGYGMFDMMTNFGAHEVIIETPEHKSEFKDRPVGDIIRVLNVLQDRIQDLQQDERLRHILIFKNKGKEAGASLAHPHHQLIALPITPKRVREELKGSLSYFKLKERCIYCDIVIQELSMKERLVYQNDGFVAFCPYAARFPFEVWIVPLNHAIDFYGESVRRQNELLADVLKTVLLRLADVLKNPPYNYIIHSAPNRFPRSGYWQTIEQDYHWHIELWPKLTQVAGFEWGSGFYINPVSPEQAAEFLRNGTSNSQ